MKKKSIQMKTIVLNGSPRKKWNTDLMLREAEKGAASVGPRRRGISMLRYFAG